jgi:hypothetical protein
VPEKETGIELRRNDGCVKAVPVKDVESFGPLIGMVLQEREPLHVVVEGHRHQDHPVTEHRVRLRDGLRAGLRKRAPAILRPFQDFAATKSYSVKPDWMSNSILCGGRTIRRRQGRRRRTTS